MKLYRRLRDKLTTWLSNEPPSDQIMPYDFNRLKYELRPGDVILIEGRSRISSVIRTLTQSTWTHAGLYIGRKVDFEDDAVRETVGKFSDAKDTARLIIEDLLEQGSVITPLNFYKNHHIRICRPIGITHSDLEQVVGYAIKSLGHGYNVRQLFDLMRFLLPWTILPRRWGSSLFRKSTGEPESGICSSLIANAFMSVQFPVLPFVQLDSNESLEVYQRNPYLFTPKDFDYSPYFEIIKYPLFNPDEPLPYYRRLPWAKNDMMHHDHGILATPESGIKKRMKLFRKHKEAVHDEKNKERS